VNGRPPPADLADRLALAILEHGALPTAKLATAVRTRRVDVTAALEESPLFVKTGRGRGTRWSLAEHRPDGVWDGMGREDRGGSRSEVTRAEFERLRRRVDELERRLADREVPA
jgi:hypothetical protein